MQVISDLIAEELNWNILYGVYEGLTGPWAIRSRVRDQIEGVVASLGVPQSHVPHRIADSLPR